MLLARSSSCKCLSANRLVNFATTVPSIFEIPKRCVTTAIPSEVDCIVIGGGSIGCSTFYHLTKFGLKNTILLEKHKLTSGTTWHTAGLHWNLRPNDIEIELLGYTRELISKILPREVVDQDTGWINNGGLFIATTKERMDEYLRADHP